MATLIDDAIVEKLRALPVDEQRKVLALVESSESGKPVRQKLRNVRGLWKGMGFTVSAEDIAEARKEMWGSFPRERFFD